VEGCPERCERRLDAGTTLILLPVDQDHRAEHAEPFLAALPDRVDEGAHAAIRRALPAVKIVQVLHVTDADVIEEACELAAAVDAFLLDSGNPNLAVKELGGTGRVHDWALSRRIVELADRPVFLAGGLRPENVQEAVARVRPFGVDLCSSVRSHGSLDPDKLAAFFGAINHVAA